MRVLITGAGGQLGRDLTTAFAQSPTHHDVVAEGHARLDVSDRDAVLQAITGFRPHIVVHAGAWTAVDACEGDADRAFRVNALGSRHVAEGAAAVDAHVVYVSTDYVFDGTATAPYREWDATNPLSVYGRSKRAGECEIQGISAKATVVRTSWVCGAHGNNMVKTVLRLAGADPKSELRFVADQHGCPTFTEDLAGMILRLATARRRGVFHVTNQGATTWYQFARDILTAAGDDPERVHPITTAELPRPAPRPANSVLDNAALRYEGIPLLDDHHIPLERLVKHLTAGSP
jgi:dTDP-4-dehydrorhamnose reductase